MAHLLSHAATASTAGLPRQDPWSVALSPLRAVPVPETNERGQLSCAQLVPHVPAYLQPPALLPAPPQGRTSDQIQVPGPGAGPADLPIYRRGPAKGWLWHEGSTRAGLPSTARCAALGCPHCPLDSNNMTHHPFPQACRDQPHGLRLRPGRERGLRGTRCKASLSGEMRASRMCLSRVPTGFACCQLF